MGNLSDALKRNKHLENQNRGLLDALKRRNAQMAQQREQSAQALAEISDLTSAYIGAICLGAEGHVVKVKHTDVKAVLEQFNVQISLDDDGVAFELIDKKAE